MLTIDSTRIFLVTVFIKHQHDLIAGPFIDGTRLFGQNLILRFTNHIYLFVLTKAQLAELCLRFASQMRSTSNLKRRSRRAGDKVGKISAPRSLTEMEQMDGRT